LNEKDVELEHLKTTMIALDQKVKVIDDCHKEVDASRRDFKESEA